MRPGRGGRLPSTAALAWRVVSCGPWAGILRLVSAREHEVTPGWSLAHIGFEGDAVSINGLNPWTVGGWGPSTGSIRVAHPSYPAQHHTKCTYRVVGPSGLVEFAAGEFSNGVWGLYVPR